MVCLLNQSFGHVVTDTATCTRHKNFFGVHFAAGEEGGFDLMLRLRSPLAPLLKGGDKIIVKVPVLKGDLGGALLGYKRDLSGVVTRY